MTKTEIMGDAVQVGDLVKVLPSKYGNHSRWDGLTMRVVKLCPPSKYGSPASAELAPANLVGVDESDAEVNFSLFRLEVVR